MFSYYYLTEAKEESFHSLNFSSVHIVSTLNLGDRIGRLWGGFSSRGLVLEFLGNGDDGGGL